MIKNKYFLLLFLLLPFLLMAQIRISGNVVDEKTKLPIENASILLIQINNQIIFDYTTTDHSGKYLLSTYIELEDKTYILQATVLGYSYQNISIDSSVIKINEVFNFSLEEQITELEEVKFQ
jgi:hypothetical protein